MNSREFYSKQLDLSIGDVVYYVIGSDSAYSIKKTKVISEKTRTRRGLDIRGPKLEYTVYETEDGRLISRSFIEKRDEMSPEQVFLTKDEAVQFVIECLHKEINREKHAFLNAQERLARAERVLKGYEKYKQ